MQELKFRNFVPSLLTVIIAVIAAAGTSYINISPLSLPVPLLIIGLFAGFLVLNFISYPKATTVQIVQLTIMAILVNAIVLVVSIFGVKYFNPVSISLNSNFILSVNPLMPLSGFLFSFLALLSLVKFEDKVIKSHISIEEKQTETKVEEIKPEVVSFEVREVPRPVEISKPVEEKIEFSLKLDDLKEEKPKSAYEELYPQAKNEPQKLQEPEKQEFFFGLDENETEIKEKAELKEEKPLETDETFIDFESVPSISFEENVQKTEAPAPSNNNEEYFDFIPTDIRLIEAPTSKQSDSKGKIASIGKLLVNNRDIEGVIESSAALAESGAEGKTNIISSMSGEHIYEKFDRLKQEFSQIKEIALIDKGGFILASNFADVMKTHIAGALIAGAYHTLCNYLSQISFNSPQKIFFETENSNNFIIKTDEELLFSLWDKEFNHIDYSSLEGFIENEEIAEADLIPLIELNQLKNFAISDGAGKLISSLNSNEQSEKLAIISAALFENFKVFLMNIQLMQLKRITILSSEEVITIQKFNDEIASFVTPIDGLVRISDEFLKMEEIY